MPAKQVKVPVKKAAVKAGEGVEKVKEFAGNGGWNRGRSRMLPFPAARAFVQKLRLKTKKEWKQYAKSGERPANIPSNPNKTYRNKGWTSMPDWIGKDGGYGAMLTFVEARLAIRKLNLDGVKEWREWCQAGKRPANIPSNPSRTYGKSGWVSFPDWLGYPLEVNENMV